uniref:DUF3850 domain-containing protein n=1 Tax=Angiostrongylus cantonensis TaxID=6313 RepID=A0A0K0CZB1_ANGCA
MDELQATKKLSEGKLERTVGLSGDVEPGRECEIIIANEWMNCKEQRSHPEENSNVPLDDRLMQKQTEKVK